MASLRFKRPPFFLGLLTLSAGFAGSAWGAPMGGASGTAVEGPRDVPSGDDAPSDSEPRAASELPGDAEKGTEARAPTDAGEAAPKKTESLEVLSEETLLARADLSVSSSLQLKNDLEVIVQATPGAPVVSVCTAIQAGSRLDPKGAPGAYRVLAEILKEGGYRSPTQDYAALVARRGGTHEVEVTRDATTFCTTVPAGELALALWVTAGRFTAGALSERNLKDAVERLAKEAELSDAEVRTGRAPERLRKMAFLGSYDYAHPTLPNPDDLDVISLDTIRELHRQSYVARRAKIAVVGGFDEKKLLSDCESQLYAARPGTSLSYELPKLVPQSTPRFSMAEDSTAQTPAAWYGWVGPPGESRVPMEIALSALVSEKRLGGQLVGRGRAAKTLDLYLDSSAGLHSYSLPRVEIVGSSSTSLGTIEKGFEDQLKALASNAMSPSEVLEVQRALRAKQVALLQTPVDRARALSRGVLLGMAADKILAPLKEDAPFLEVSPEQVSAAAASLLDAKRRSAIEIYPKGWQDPWQEPMRKFHLVSPGETLGSIARQHGTTVAVIVQMNKMKQSQTIYPGDKLRVPRGAGEKEKKLRTHTVRRGETLSALALKYGVSVRAIADENGMGSKLTIRTGETLRIPSGGKEDAKKGAPGASGSSSTGPTSGATETPTHKVTAGETLSGIAKKHGVTSVALARANGISHKAMVREGQTLKLPPPGAGKAEPAPTVATVVYTVKSGDTLSGIAAKHGVTVAALTAENHISRKSTLRLGQTLKIPAKK